MHRDGNFAAFDALLLIVSMLRRFAMRDAYAQLGIGMVWGVTIGGALGFALFNSIAMGAAVGIAIGASIAGVLFAANED